jgi:4a-hydroxytetrahydrobiopterin dehydratase
VVAGIDASDDRITTPVYPKHSRVGQQIMTPPQGWTIAADGKAIERSFRFTDFAEAFGFLTRVALHAEKQDHHPEFTSVWNRVDFRLTSHDAGKVTERDIGLAETINRLAERGS